MNEQLRQFERESHIDVYGLGKDRVKWEAALEKFAELIVAEFSKVLFDESERLSGLYSEEANWQLAEEYEIRSNQCIENITLIEKHFGVEE
jgi:hypothetical protein